MRRTEAPRRTRAACRSGDDPPTTAGLSRRFAWGREQDPGTLYQAMLAIGSELDLGRRLERVLNAAMDVTDAREARIMLEGSEADALEVVAVRGRLGPEGGDRWARRAVLTGRVMAENRPVRTGDERAETLGRDGGIVAQPGVRSWLGVPLAERRRAFGVLAVASDQVDAFDAGDEVRLASLAALAASAIREKRLREQVVEDLAERERANEELARQGEFLRKIFDNVPISICLIDEHGKLALVNAEFERIFGWTPADVAGIEQEWFARTIPDAAEREQIVAFMAAATGEWAEFEVITTAQRHVRVSAAVVQLSDGSRIGLAQDVTEQKHAQEELFRREQEARAVVETTPDVVSRIDRELRFVYVNPAFERAAGLPSSAILGSRTGDREMAASAAEAWRLALGQVFETGREQSVDTVWMSPNGERLFEVRIAPEFASDGSVEHVVTVGRDCTDRARREEQQMMLYRELLEREDRLRELVRDALLARDREQQRGGRRRELEELTRRERDTLRLLAQGLSTRQIADRLVLSPGTVKGYVATILGKLGVQNRTQAAIRARELGLGEDPPR